MGLADWFSTFCANLQIQDDGTISSRYKAITRRLNTDFWSTTSDTAHSFYVGSYGRNTAINGFTDLDIVFELAFGSLLAVRQTCGQWPVRSPAGCTCVHAENL